MNGIKLSESTTLTDWKNIHQSWEKELFKVAAMTNGLDAPFVHAEHGSTHHLGVSASVAGYSTIREMIGNRFDAKGNERNARLDLCLISDESVDLVEVKWKEFNCSSIPKNIIKDLLNQACDEVNRYTNSHPLFTKNTESSRRIGVMFLSPYFSAGFDKDLIEELLQFIDSKVKPDLYAWCFPEEAKTLKYWNRIYPGTIMIVKRAS